MTRVQPEERQVQLANGQSISYDECFVCPGGAPRLLPVEGETLANIFPLRTPEDAQNIAASVDGKHVAIVGSSFVGMEVAALIVKNCSSVTVIGMESTTFERVLGAEVGAVLERLHRSKGVQFRMNSVVQKFAASAERPGQVGSVTIKTGEQLEQLACDVVVMGAGVVPSSEMFKDSGIPLERDRSVVADQGLQVRPHLYVGGDIARYPFFLSGANVRIEHLGMAQFHGSLAARNMLGMREVCESVPFFWTTPYGKSVRYAGHAHQYDQVLVDGSLEDMQFAAYYCQGDKVLAVATLNMDPVAARAAEFMRTNAMPSASFIQRKLKDGSFQL